MISISKIIDYITFSLLIVFDHPLHTMDEDDMLRFL